MKTKHTPGPWRLHFWTENVGVISDRPKARDSETVATIFRGSETGADSARETAEANARLIAAAPDLLEALTAAVKWASVDTGQHAAPHWLPAARAALAKAKGETK